MFRARFWLCVCAALICFCVAPAAAQSQWQELAQIKPGAKVQVVENSLRSTSGRFVGFTESSITLTADGREVVIPKEKVYRVSVSGKNRKRNVLIGLAVGAGVGTGIGAATNQVVKEAGVIPAMAAVFAGVGAGVGAVVPAAKTVYRSETPKETAERKQPDPR